MSNTPQDLHYSPSHEWVRVEGDIATLGITDHAQQALNDIVFVELPQVGDTFEQEQEFGVVESVKSVSELYAPIAGEVVEVNDGLEDAPETLNSDPYGDGWLLKLRMTDPEQIKQLQTADEYAASVA